MTMSTRTIPFVILSFLAAMALAVILFVEWLHAPSSHVIAAVKYLGASGIASLALGTTAIVLASRWAPRLAVKIGIASLFGSAVAIINVLVTPLLMFQESADRTILVITLLYFFVLSLAFAALVAAITTRRLEGLHAGARRLAEGDLGTSVDVDGTDEIADLATAFNHMSTELRSSFERERMLEASRRELVTSVSHDLRTPVASIRAMAAALADGVVETPEDVGTYVRRIGLEAEHLGRLIDDLFEVARIESGNLELHLSDVPVEELVSETVAGMQMVASRKHVALLLQCNGALPVRALDAPRMQRVLVNLIDNAIRHTPSGGEVRVEVQTRGSGVEIAIEDTGEGITPDEAPHVFDRFYRGERSRSRDTGGAGLGLAIARGVTQAHGGSLDLESASGRGSRFVVRL